MASTPSTSAFTKAVVSSMRKLYPEELADKSFDNTGLLLEAPHRPHLKNTALLTIDLTQAVATEAIQRKYSIIIAYHPIIFVGLKSLTLANTQQTTLLRLAQEGISVYCPHTAVDAVPNGLTDWLADIVIGTDTVTHEGKPQSLKSTTSIKVLTPTPAASSLPNFTSAGHGRLLTFSHPQSLTTILTRIKTTLNLSHLHLSIPDTKRHPSQQQNIRTVGICAGSGSMLTNLDADLLFTGELSHHEALAAKERGVFVVTTGHSNSERGYLNVMKERLSQEILKVVEREGLEGGKLGFRVDVSEMDRDPYTIY